MSVKCPYCGYINETIDWGDVIIVSTIDRCDECGKPFSYLMERGTIKDVETFPPGVAVETRGETREETRKRLGVSKEFADASNHPAHCRCALCLDWWASMSPEDPGAEREYPSSPFTDEEIALVKRYSH